MIKKYFSQPILLLFFCCFFNNTYGQLIANNDSVYTLGAPGNILWNDTLNGQSVTGSDVIISYTSTDPNFTIDVNGLISYPGISSGVLIVTYQICEATNPGNCYSANVYFYAAGNINALDDAFPGIYSAFGSNTASVLLNDSINGIPVTPTDVLVSLVSTTSANLFLNSSGTITVAPGTPAGTYTLTYQICEVLSFINCDVAVATVQVLAPPPSCWQSVSIGDYHTSAIKTDGTLWSWGGNGLGNLGIGNTTDSSFPVQVGTDTDWKFIAVGDYHTLAIKNNGTLWAWGWNQYSQLGDGTTINRNSPIQIGMDTDWKFASALYGSSSAIKTNNTLWCWGDNTMGSVGNGTTINQTTPVQISTDTNWKTISVGDAHSMAIKTTGTLWTWGVNDRGQLGNASTTNVSSPIPTGTAASFNQWKAVSASRRYTLGLLNDGTMWAWGENTLGQLGDGTTTNSNIPIQVGSDTNWAIISAGYFHRLAIKNDGTLWAWGVNQVGALGDGTTTDRSTPVQIGTDTDWVKISAKYNHSAAMKSDGSLWVWGRNLFGALGDGTNTNQSSPIMVSCATLNTHETFSEIATTIYPNPSSGKINVESNNIIKQIEMYDLNGRMMLFSKENTSNVTLNIERFSNGIYLLKVISDQGTSIQKIIKK
ncbi:T9SS type A sorting domain-containing protein [Flavobacterium sp.]|uniref:T9SS type A sorting domain-containing protein n=1 Tax=Flavobacterium sp. TaxID=239 RepID=UPI00286CE4EB|nr:T9SS type A sorting domain-containing protein [Flavobacterium sp.]